MWKYIGSRPRLQDKGVEALKQMQLMCSILLPSDINQFHANIVSHLPHRFNVVSASEVQGNAQCKTNRVKYTLL
jgi:hypothetical protein